MTDTGQVPGEGLPENAGMVEQPGVPAPGAYTYLDPSENPAESVAPAEDDDLLLMPGAQGAWSEAQSAQHAAVAQGVGQQGVGQQGVGQAVGDASLANQYAAGQPVAGQPVAGQLGGDPSVAGQSVADQPLADQSVGAQSAGAQSVGGQHAAAQQAFAQQSAGQPQPQAMHQPGPHETAGRDSGSVDLNGVQLPGAPTPAPASHPGPSRRPLHRGPSGPAVPDGSGSPVRSLADRGPAGAPQHAAPVRHAGPPTVGPEYLDIPRDEEGMPPGQQLGENAPQGATPWTSQPQHSQPSQPSQPSQNSQPSQYAQSAQSPQPSQSAQPAQAAESAESAQAAAPAETVVPDVTPVTEGTPEAPAPEAPQPAPAAETPAVAFPQAADAADPAIAQGTEADDQFAQTGAEAGQPAFAVDAEQPSAEQPPAVAPSAPAPEPSQEPAHAQGSGQPQFAMAGAQPWSDAPLAGAGHAAQGPHIPQAPQPQQAQQAQQYVEAPVAQAPQGEGLPSSPSQPFADPQEPAPLGQFVPVEGSVPTTPHLAPTPPQALSVPPEHFEAPQPETAEAQPEPAVAEAAPPVADLPEAPAAPEASEPSVAPEPPVAQEPSALLEAAGPAEPAEPAEAPEAAETTEVPEPASPQPVPTVPAPRDGGEPAAATPVQETAPESAPETAAEPVAVAPVPAEEAAEATPLAVADVPAEAEPVAVAEAPEPLAVVEAAPVEVAEAADPMEAADEAAPSEPAQQPEPVQQAEPVQQSEVPAAPAYDDAEREAVLRVMRERRDIRNGFRSDAIPHEVLLRVLEAAHTAPSVGHSQPWDFVVIRSAETRRTMHELAMRQKDAYAKSLPKGRAKQFKELKIEAILDTPVNIVVTADPTRGGRHTLGRHTQPQMAPYSSALAVENLWLAARAEGLGVGWVSFFDQREMVRTLGLPEHLEVVAYLCVGYVDEFPEEPELMQAGWSKRRPLSWVVHEETYGRRALPGEDPSDLLAETVSNIRPLDAKALGEAWERQKRMTKPPGALGMLEIISAQLSGLSRQCPPPIPEPAAVAIFAGDHGVHAQGVTAWPQEVTAQMVANFLGGGAVCNAFANQVGAEVCVIDVGVASELPATPGLLPRKIRAGTADMTTGPALSREEVKAAIEVGIETARDLVAAGNKALLTGEMGIANTTASAALISVYTDTDPGEVTGRGTGINDEMHSRKVDVVRRALELHQPDPADPIGVLAAIGGLEHAAMVGLLLGGASLRTPVILDGVSAGAAALVARAIAPEVLAACIAGHRSAEPGHVAALNKLGLRPLVDLDLRLGEGTGALLALPVVQSAARAMHEVATFDSAGVTEK
ncbi:nicotinate-nucleotide--dimethylbenzimidazole phosphoribosyltransferase [Streptomyces sp. BA2]|uniref:nicotinate-nucleotide--dimethylbenzimidazole phosphoribosyltransferase n=1 Tax=Streptomyces sp. BA2 TaxID=436595 RepID=UPI0013210D5D|nr:nicotinate-nucleotide--dimethylbenzimidazole phosphoribosyltransferase [Streptomyces sp. BA2]MWA09895.1 nicotinate-nucleotide--dimethylbenzimidazole phosphoribosyltransferase [Streptomyces sp. BA2]